MKFVSRLFLVYLILAGFLFAIQAAGFVLVEHSLLNRNEIDRGVFLLFASKEYFLTHVFCLVLALIPTAAGFAPKRPALQFAASPSSAVVAETARKWRFRSA